MQNSGNVFIVPFATDESVRVSDFSANQHLEEDVSSEMEGSFTVGRAQTPRY